MATLRLTNVTKIYDNDFIAVDGFDLDVKDKEFIVLVGPSGCGKSTTLRMIAGLESITEGTIEIDGEVVNDLQPKDRGIAMVFQNYALFPHLTVYDNIAFSLRLRKVPEDIIEKKVREVAEVLGISEHLRKKPKALSGGQKQRVAIGRAMVRDSSVFLLDEPLSNLDAKLRNQMRAELILLRERLNTTFIYVTHDQTEAMTLGDRIVVMKDGRIMQVGTPAEVFNSPKNLFVATFIGSPAMNVLDAQLVKTAGGFAVECLGAVMPVGAEKNAELAKCPGSSVNTDEVGSGNSKAIKLGIRPEHISISREPSAKAFPAIVLVNEMMGSELQLHVRTENGDTVVVRVATRDLSTEHTAVLTSGSRIYLSFDGPFMHFFDPETEENILSELYN